MPCVCIYILCLPIHLSLCAEEYICMYNKYMTNIFWPSLYINNIEKLNDSNCEVQLVAVLQKTNIVAVFHLPLSIDVRLIRSDK